MSVEIMQPQLVEQGLFHDLVREKERVDAHLARQKTKRAREMAIDEHGAAVLAVAGNVRNVIGAVHHADASADRFYDVQQNLIVDIFRFVLYLAIELHAGSPSR